VVPQIEGDRRVEVEGRDVFLLEPRQFRGFHEPSEGLQRGFNILFPQGHAHLVVVRHHPFFLSGVIEHAAQGGVAFRETHYPLPAFFRIPNPLAPLRAYGSCSSLCWDGMTFRSSYPRW